MGASLCGGGGFGGMKVYEIKLDFIALAKKYAGKWVALRPDIYEVITAGSSAQEVLEAAARAGVDEPLITDVVESYGSYVPCALP